ncbi:MAG: TetR/AcrR family transcriptional regulator [Acidimicrobiales bacterium]
MTSDTTHGDRRGRRREAKLATILAQAWVLARRDGLAAISLRDLADSVDLRQPSLYAYFESKLGLYDLMFADANRQLLQRVKSLPLCDDPRQSLVEFTEALVRFSTQDVVRHQLLFQRTIPGFEPSPNSYALALEFYEVARNQLAALDVTDATDVDVFSALVSGLAHQQVANDPGGDRWVRLAELAVDMYLADVDRRRPRTARKGAQT